jgi:hypothetical protein
METYEFKKSAKQKPELVLNDKNLYKNVNWDLLPDLEQDGYVITDQESPSFLDREIEETFARELIHKTFNSVLRELRPSKWFRLNDLEKMIKKKIDDTDISFVLYSDTDRKCYLFYLDSVEDDKMMYGTFVMGVTDIQHVIVGVCDERSFVDCTYFHYGSKNSSKMNARLSEITAKNIRENLQEKFVEFLATQ